jgi:hypothetical protein
MYIYPENLRSSPTLFLWRLKDLTAIGIFLVLSVFIFSKSGFSLPIAFTIAYAILCVRFEDTGIKDFIGFAFNYFLVKQQEYSWRKCDNYGEKRK